MSFSENSIEAIFANKKDKNYVQLKSHYYFLEAFSLSDIKCTGIRIPETILIEHGGNIKNWIFTSKKDEDLPILKKRPDKLNTAEVFSYFNEGRAYNQSKSKTGPSFFAEKIAKIREYKEPKAIVRYINGMLDLLDMTELQDYLQTGLNYLKIIQATLGMKTKSDFNSSETYYCEYRHDDPLMPVAYRFVKKVSQFSNPEENISSNSYVSKVLFKGSSTKPFSDKLQTTDALTIDGLAIPKESKVVAILIKKNNQKIYRVFDTPTNQKLEKLTKQISIYLAQSFRIVVKKLICKFALDNSNEFYFMGIKELYVDLKDKNLFEPGREVMFEEMVNTAKTNDKEKEALLLLSLEEKVKKKNTKILKEECQGDFCDFISLDSMKLAELSSGHNVAQYFQNNEKKFTRKLPYEITYNLVRRCKQDPLEIKEIFKHRKIFPKYYAELVNDSPQALNNVDFDVKFKKTDHDNLINMYKFVKICKNCYPIYVTLQRALITENEPKLTVHNHFSRTFSRGFNIMSAEQSKSRISSAIQSPSGVRTPASGFSAFKNKAKEFPDYVEEKLNDEPKPIDDARKNLKRILNGNNHTKSFTKAQEVQNMKAMHKSAQTSSSHQYKQKLTTQRLNLGVSTYNKKFSGVLMSTTNESQIQVEENSIAKARPLIRHKHANSMYDQNFVSIKRKSSLTLAEEKERFEEEKKSKLEEIHNKTLKRLASNVRRATVLDPFSAKKKSIIKGLTNLSTEERPLLPLTTLLLIAKKLNMNTVLFELKQLLHKRKEMNKGEKEVSSLFHHGVFDSIRRIPPFSITIPKPKMNTEFKMVDKPNLDINRVCDLGGYEIPTKYVDFIRVFIADEHTAIPYALISSDIENYKCNDVIVVCHDMFGNLIEDIDYFIQYTQKAKNTKFVLFNLPGQSYTLFKEEHVYNNDYNAALIDSLLEYLYNQEKIDPRVDIFKFIGIGYGANILLCYNNFATNSFITKGAILTINPFIYINDIMKQTLEKSKDIFLEAPDTMAEMPNLYYNLTFGNGKMTKEEALEQSISNQININGRITVINGILQSLNLQNAILDISSSIVVLHTLQNSITSNDQTYSLCRQKGKSLKSSPSKLRELMTDMDANRMVLHSKGYYAAFEEREQEVLQVIEDFLIASQDQNNLLDWILNEKVLGNTEQEIMNLQELELEEARSYIEKLSDMKKVSKDAQKAFLAEAEEFLEILNAKLKEIEHKVLRSEENLNLLKVTSMEKIQRKEITPGMLEKVKKTHEERLSSIKKDLLIIHNHNKEPLNLLLTIAQTLQQLENVSTGVTKASHAKILNQHQSEFHSTMASHSYDYGKINELIVITTGLLIVYKEAMKTLKETFSNIQIVEGKYKVLPPIPLFEHNIQGVKAKGTDMEVHVIQLRNKLALVVDNILQSFVVTELKEEETVQNIEEILVSYHSELMVLVSLLKTEEPNFVKLNTNLDDPNYINSPGYLYTMAKMEIEKLFTRTMIEKRINEFNQKAEETLKQKKFAKNEEILKSIKELIRQTNEMKSSLH